jgi:hypothetical protein
MVRYRTGRMKYRRRAQGIRKNLKAGFPAYAGNDGVRPE